MEDKIRVAVVTGEHEYDALGFVALFQSMSDMMVDIQPLEDWAAKEDDARLAYDAVVFYNFHQPTPEGRLLEALESIGQSAQGIVVLHHALLAFPEWPLWSEIVGIADRRFRYYHDEKIHVEVAEPEHPITRSLFAWNMVDETYAMNNAAEGSQVLLTTRHPHSMATLAWTRRFGQAQVFCLELGHDNQAFSHPAFRLVLSRGIRWVVGKL